MFLKLYNNWWTINETYANVCSDALASQKYQIVVACQYQIV